jgi:hypothetical protein
VARGLTDYLSDWDKPGRDGDAKNASGADSSGQVDGKDYDGGNPYRWDAPVSPEWGIGAKDTTSYGHSDDVKDTGTKSSAWGMDRKDQARGFERPASGGAGEPGTASYPQSIPTENPTNPPERYAREGHGETGVHTGRGAPKSTSNPGGETIGSSKLVG